MRIFLEIKLCARARNVPILDGLDFIKFVGVAICWIGVDGVNVFCCCEGGGLVSVGKEG